MKKLLPFFMLTLFTLLMAACSAEAIPFEDLGSEQQAVDTILGTTTGTCTRPTGGTLGSPPSSNRHVTGISRGAIPTDTTFVVQTTEIGTGIVHNDTVDFGANQAWIRDGGWSGPNLSQLVIGHCDPNDNRYVCITFRGTGSTDGDLKFRGDRSAPTWTGTSNVGDRCFAIQGVGQTVAQGLRFWGINDTTGVVFSKTFLFDGAYLNACTSP